MMQRLRAFSMIVILMLVLSGCRAEKTAKNEEADVPVKEQEVQGAITPEEKEIQDFFEKYVRTEERPVAIMVDNDDDKARPHAGLNEAYLIYEMLIEGGSTRFMALYRGTETPKIGPVRSARHYFLDYVMENDAIYTHYGWSPKAMQDIASFRINKINGVLGSDDSIFWRERKYKGDWHSAYTNIKNIKDMAASKKYSDETAHKNSIKYSKSYILPDSQTSANEISLKYSYKYTTGYSYNIEKELYEKTINGEPHIMQKGEVLEVKNIIIKLIEDTSLGDGSDRRNINTTGSGKGYYITNGRAIEIEWSKPSRRENTVYKKEDGTELTINPGKTIINVISPSAKITIE